jgi:hypothetical protein
MNTNTQTPQDMTNEQLKVIREEFEKANQKPELVETIEGDLREVEDCYYCDFYDQYSSEPTQIVHTRYFSNGNFSDAAIEEYTASNGLHYFEGEYYEHCILWRHDLAIPIDGSEVYRVADLYCHPCGDFYTYPHEGTEEYLREYHSDSNVYFHRFSSEKPQFFIGYEIEKEDEDALKYVHIDEFETCCPKWRKESDGSLDDQSGFELVSPCFELNPEAIRDYIASSNILMVHVNADKSDRCGGHINISEDGKTGRELFDSVQGYTPLLHALYYKRIDKHYSTGKSNNELKSSRGDKYQSIRIHNNRIELRIISAVPNLKTLYWRTRLVNFMLKNQTSDPREAFLNFHDTNNELNALIREVYNTPEKFAILNNRLITYTRSFEEIDLTDEETTQRAKEKGVDTTPDSSTSQQQDDSNIEN